MDNKYNYLVATRCMTYNQAKYIEDTLRGFATQEISFPAVFIIVDDASTDGEPEILKSWANKNLLVEDKTSLWEDVHYGHLAIAPLKGNPSSLFVFLLLKENYYQTGRHSIKMEYISKWFDNAKYQALCEGDDYWIYPLKLQRQIEFMESHPDYSMCFHNAVVIYDDVPKHPRIFNTVERDKDISINELAADWIVPTASMLYRKTCMPLFPVKERIVSGDYQMILHFAGKGKVHALKDVMSVYRMTYCTDSQTSRNRDKAAFMCYQKHHILDCFDEYTQYKYHNIVSKYSKFWYDYSVFTRRKNKSILWAVLSMPVFVLKKVINKH